MSVKSVAAILFGSGCLAVLFIISTSQPLIPREQAAAFERKSRVVATVGSRSISLTEVEQAIPLPLYQADEQRSRLLHQAVHHLIDEELLATEAARVGTSVPELLEKAGQSESVAKLAGLPGPVRQAGADGRKGEVSRQPFRPQDLSRIRQALLVSLRRKTDVRLTLPPLEPPILQVSVDDDPSTGPVDAPVTIVEFSDFQCPYCRKSVAVLKELRRIYGQKIRVVYRDYPGPNHPYALQAAEAAQCAAEQGKFWEYHDLLFDRQAPGKGWDFPALAKELGLKQDAFAACITTGRYREEVTHDLQEAIKLGMTSTPTFFINGRPLVGAQPVAAFQALIDKLLHPQPRS